MPAVRKLLTLWDREEISRGLAENLRFKQIAARIGRDPSVVSREVRRHGGRAGYRAAVAGEAWAARQRPKTLAVERSPRLREVVVSLLRTGWSPASIAGRLPIDYRQDQACRVSHEAIYRWIYAQPVATLARELISPRSGRTARRGGPRPAPAPRTALHRPTAWRGRGAGGAGALGRRPRHRHGPALRGGNPGRTHLPVPGARPADRARRAVRRGRRDRRRRAVARAPAPVTDLGRWRRDGPPRHRHRHDHPGLCRPPPQPVAAWQQRKPQPHRPRVLPQGCGDHLRPRLPHDGRRRDQRPPP